MEITCFYCSGHFPFCVDPALFFHPPFKQMVFSCLRESNLSFPRRAHQTILFWQSQSLSGNDPQSAFGACVRCEKRSQHPHDARVSFPSMHGINPMCLELYGPHIGTLVCDSGYLNTFVTSLKALITARWKKKTKCLFRRYSIKWLFIMARRYF